jgi:myosin heavy subunit
MSGQLRKHDIIQQQEIQDALAAIAKSVQPIIEAFSKVAESAQKAESIIKLAANIKQISESSKNAGENTKKLTDAEKELIKVQKQIDVLLARQNEQYKKLNKDKQQLLITQQKENAAVKQAILLNKSARGSYNELDNQLNANIKKYKELTEEQRKNKSVGGALLTTIKQQDAALKKMDAAMGRSQRNVGAYGAAIKRVAFQFLGALGLTSAVYIFVNALKGAFSTIRDFSKENAVLAGVLGKTRSEITQLTNQAVSLGAIYPITASEVNKLQVSYARLGFTQNEIINLTESTIQASLAMNSSLDDTATLVGAVVIAFNNLGSENSPEIVDKLTLATQRSALAFSDLGTAIPKVAGAANALGISLDAMLAQLGTAQDATLDASIAGTSLRKIYLELSKRGITLSEALEQINTSSNRLNEAYNLFGIRAAVVGLALADNIEKTSRLEAELSNAAGTVERVAKEQMSTLDGSVKQLESSWEKLILSFRNSEGFLSYFFKRLASELDIASSRYLSFTGKIIARTKLFGKGLREFNTETMEALSAIQKASNEEELEQVEQKYSYLLGRSDKFDKDMFNAIRNRYDSLETAQADNLKREQIAKTQAELEQIAIEEEAAKERSKIAKKESEEKLKTWVDETYRRAKIQNEADKNQKQIEDEFQKLIEEDEKKFDKTDEQNRIDTNNEILAAAEEATHNEYLLMLAASKDKIKLTRGNANEIKRIDDELTNDLIANEIKILETAIAAMDADTNAYRQAAERLRRLKEQQGEEEIKQYSDIEKIKTDLRKQTTETAVELLNEGFSFANTLYDAQLQRLRERHDVEISLAGDSVEKRILAERKYDKERSKIMKRQAIAQKAQAALGIAMNTAQAIISIWAQVPKFDFGISAGLLTAMVAGLGALQLASVLATPIPEFAKGTKDAPGTFIAGEKGQEVILKDDGTAVLTPDKPTLFSDKSFIGSTILPHDETQKWLANYAVTQSHDMIDMSSTNKYLKKIADNTANKKEIFVRNGNTYMRRGHITSKIA